MAHFAPARSIIHRNLPAASPFRAPVATQGISEDIQLWTPSRVFSGVRVKLVGSVAPALEHIQASIRVGGWSSEAVARAAAETQVLLERLVKDYTEHAEIGALSSVAILSHISEHSAVFAERFDLELISLTVQSPEPTDPEIAEALRQQEQARLAGENG